MSDDSEQLRKSLLMELYQATKGDTAQTVSMYELGSTLGLNRAAAGTAAEELMVAGLAELRTLAGGISITAEGLAALGFAAVESRKVEAKGHRLSNGPLVDNDDRLHLTALLANLRALPCGDKSIVEMEELIIDLKTLEVQLLSPAAKTAIVREVLLSLLAACKGCGNETMITQLQGLLA